MEEIQWQECLVQMVSAEWLDQELTIELATKLGQAGAYVLTKEQEHQATIIVGCDTRISGGMLASALMAGICSVGANAILSE